MKIKVTLIIFCATVVFFTGMSIAYYNTKSFGFDENTKIANADNEKITIFDFDIYYKDIDTTLKTVRKYLPTKPQTI